MFSSVVLRCVLLGYSNLNWATLTGGLLYLPCRPFLFFSLWLGNLFAHFERNQDLSGRKFIARSFCFG